MPGFLLEDDAKQDLLGRFDDYVKQAQRQGETLLKQGQQQAQSIAQPVAQQAVNYGQQFTDYVNQRRQEFETAQQPAHNYGQQFLDYANNARTQAGSALNEAGDQARAAIAPQQDGLVTQPAQATAATGAFKDISQFGNDQLTAEEAYSACGPAAAVRWAQMYGRNPTLREATDLARQFGWTPNSGMAGISSQQQLLKQMGVDTHIVAGSRWDDFAREASSGNPITISTPGHYFFADAYDPGSGKFHVGQSGRDLTGGSEWMSPQEMERRMGAVQGALYADHPAVPTKSANPGAVPDIKLDTSSPEAFIRSIAPAAQAVADRTGIPAAAMIGMAANETGFGKFAEGNNLFGIKGKGPAGSINAQTWEDYGAGPVTIRDAFRAYDNLTQSFQDFADLIMNAPRYAAAKGQDTVAGFVGALKAGGYMTDPNYVGKIQNIVDRYMPQIQEASSTVGTAARQGLDDALSTSRGLLDRAGALRDQGAQTLQSMQADSERTTAMQRSEAETRRMLLQGQADDISSRVRQQGQDILADISKPRDFGNPLDQFQAGFRSPATAARPNGLPTPSDDLTNPQQAQSNAPSAPFDVGRNLALAGDAAVGAVRGAGSEFGRQLQGITPGSTMTPEEAVKDPIRAINEYGRNTQTGSGILPAIQYGMRAAAAGRYDDMIGEVARRTSPGLGLAAEMDAGGIVSAGLKGGGMRNVLIGGVELADLTGLLVNILIPMPGAEFGQIRGAVSDLRNIPLLGPAGADRAAKIAKGMQEWSQSGLGQMFRNAPGTFQKGAQEWADAPIGQIAQQIVRGPVARFLIDESGELDIDRLLEVAKNFKDRAQEIVRGFHGGASDYLQTDLTKDAGANLVGPGLYLTSDPRVAGGVVRGEGRVRPPEIQQQIDDLMAKGDRRAAVNLRTKYPNEPGGETLARGYAQNRQPEGFREAESYALEQRQVRRQLQGVEQDLAADLAPPGSPREQMMLDAKRSLEAHLARIDQRIQDIAGTVPAGPNVRAIDMPRDMDLLDLEEPTTPEINQRVIDYLDNYGPDRPDSFNAESALGKVLAVTNYGERAVDGMRLWEALSSVDRNFANRALEAAGFEGLRYSGGKRIPMTDPVTGESVSHDVRVLFQNGLDRSRNAYSGGPAAFTSPIAGALGAEAGTDEEDPNRGLKAGAGALVGLAASPRGAARAAKAAAEAVPKIPLGVRLRETGFLAPGETQAAGTLRRLQERGLASAQEVGNALLGQARTSPQHLQGVMQFLTEQRQKLLSGQMTDRDVIKAYLLTMSSIRDSARELPDAQRVWDQFGVKLAPEAVSQGTGGRQMVRPEDAFAQWLLSPEGKQTLDALEQGDVSAARAGSLMQQLRKPEKEGGTGASMMSLGNPASRDLKPEEIKAGIKNLTNIRDLTPVINELGQQGDIQGIVDQLGKLVGVGTAKEGFVAHLLGMGDFPTVDSNELNIWVGKEKAPELFEAVNQSFGSKGSPAALEMRQMLMQRIGELQQAGYGSDIPPESFQHVMHHWLFDEAIKGQTEHQALYKAQRLAVGAGAALGGAQADEDDPNRNLKLGGAALVGLMANPRAGARAALSAAELAGKTVPITASEDIIRAAKNTLSVAARAVPTTQAERELAPAVQAYSRQALHEVLEALTPNRIASLQQRVSQVLVPRLTGGVLDAQQAQQMMQRILASGLEQLQDSLTVITGAGNRGTLALARHGQFTGKFTQGDLAAATDISQAVVNNAQKAGEAPRIDRPGALDFTGREGGSDVAFYGSSQIPDAAGARDPGALPRVYSYVGAGEPLVATAAAKLYYVWRPQTPMVVTFHHHFGPLAPDYPAHEHSTGEGIKEIMWRGEQSLVGATTEATPFGPRKVGWQDQGIDVGDGRQIASTDLAVGPSGAADMRMMTLLASMPTELANAVRSGRLTDPDVIAALLLRGESPRVQPARTEAFNMMNPTRKTGPNLNKLTPTEAARLNQAAIKQSSRTEALVIDPQIEDLAAIYINQPERALAKQVGLKRDNPDALNLRQVAEEIAARAKAAGNDIPIRHLNPTPEIAGREIIRVQPKMISEAETIGGAQGAPPISPGRQQIVDNYLKAPGAQYLGGAVAGAAAGAEVDDDDPNRTAKLGAAAIAGALSPRGLKNPMVARLIAGNLPRVGGAIAGATASEFSMTDKEKQDTIGRVNRDLLGALTGSIAPGAIKGGFGLAKGQGPDLAQLRSQFDFAARQVGPPKPGTNPGRTVAGEVIATSKDWMLSGLGTHVMNLSSQLAEMIKQPLVAAVSGREQDALLGLMAMGGSIPDAWRAARQAALTGVTSQTRAGAPNTHGSHIFLRALGAADDFFRVIAGNMGATMEAQRLIREAGAVTQADMDAVIRANANDIFEAGKKSGTSTVFSNEGGKGVGQRLSDWKQDLLSSTNKGTQLLGLAVDALVPFSGVPDAIWRLGLQRTPVLGEAVHAWKMARGLAIGDTRTATHEGAELLVQSLLSMTIISNVAAGNVTGPDNPERPSSVKIGGQWYDYSGWGPFQIPFAVPAAMYEATTGVSAKQGKNGIDWTNPRVQEAAFASTLRVMSDASYLSTAVDLLHALGDGDSGPRTVGKTAIGYASRFVPWGGLGGSGVALTDPIARDVSKELPGAIPQTVMSRIPGLSQQLPARIDPMTGQPEQRAKAGLGGVLAREQSRPISPLESELNRLNRAGYSEVKPFTKYPDTVSRGGSEIKLSETEQRAMAQLRGADLARFQAEVRTPSYQRMSDDDKAMYWKRVLATISGQNAARWSGITPEAEERKRLDAAKQIAGRRLVGSGAP
jgi:flagellum-specific peptidoglycan hydrolase FlgJ